MRVNFSTLLLPSLLQGLGACAAPNKGNDDFAAKCASLKKSLKLPGTTVYFTQHVSAGTNITFPDNHPTCGPNYQVTDVEVCRVAMLVKTGPASNVSIEAWLPLNWTGRFLGTGNGGLAGCMPYNDMAYGNSFGFASVGTNNGHNGTSGLPMYRNPGVVEDFAYRAVHAGAVIGKKITQGFYGKKFKSYFLGCSTGGRQAMKLAQSFPEDYDGYVAGAPAMRWNGLQARSGSFWGITGPPGAPGHVTPDEWEMVHKSVLTQCDEPIDGVDDGVLEDPTLCQYRPEALICGKGQTENCLTKAKIETVRKVFSPLYTTNETYVYPRAVPGANALFNFVVAETPFVYSTEWYQYVIWEDPEWNPDTIGPKDYDRGAEMNPYDIETWEGDLSKFRKRGNKMIHWHGLQDGLISAENSDDYYNHVSRTMGLNSSQLDQFYRFFRVSGCGHCSAGDGASRIGNNAGNMGGKTADTNVLLAIVKWVEEGVAPETIGGYKNVGGTADGAFDYERRHCRYPHRNVWDGKGNVKDPDSWNCKI
ncbi:uncharacterized protein NECHADRAFT_44313 [Fusarium vanettenii 77-13-4]|uniref:Carboxylic ester hydrolase n=1 Tax=Fusarium vanettenii (strain ATCC MYA-4622 / CBS 123669 / FGSC 9596 / NRRL 45880 / 77-13-4) TaxID=660122 RepID=C7ZJM2_FUSV7|nr:uncharacterized protein NECHADRAFT_44313 [Fusarium vanettenii 77-13-4]EEU35764.1 hypothetical protein NECHADRAFT_44313 [Fusarium vanettenii 77-13-4]